MRYFRETDTVVITAEELSSYAVKKNISPSALSGGFERIDPSEEIYGDGFSLDVLSADIELKNITLQIRATPERVFPTHKGPTVELVSYAKNVPYRFNVSYNSELLAEGVTSSFVFAKNENEDTVKLRLTFISRETGESVSFQRAYTTEQLTRMTEVLVSRAEPFVKLFAERESVRLDEIKKLSFPYGDVRGGQHELMLGVMKTVRRGGKLIASAPTGTGKTMATLYPAVKALGEKYIDRIFYLTGKTVTGKAAYDAMNLLSEKAPQLRCIMIHSKERGCAENHEHDSCFVCPRMNEVDIGGDIIPYKMRRDMALAEILDEHNMYDSKLVSEYAEKYKLCPYELSLDISEFCDTVICDYNYVFDKKVYFRRYFAEERGEKYAFLIDECHNLPDRVRASYSAAVDDKSSESLECLLREELIGDTELGQALARFKESLSLVKEDCADNTTIVADKTGDHSVGYSKTERSPDALIRACSVLSALCRCRSREKHEFRDVFDSAADTFGSFSSAAASSGDGFAFLAQSFDESMTCSVICLDPSEIIKRMTDAAHATVMFSATLNPIDYFADMLGCSDAPVIRAESPFDPDNLSVTVFDGISTRLGDRKNTASEIAEVIARVIEAKEGHYFVFFPSYAYMKTVCRELLNICPDIRAVMQKKNMTYAEREKFLSAFKSKKFKNIVGLCVLGGIFSEGVDLAGDDLIGVIVVGAGLPGISSELNLMSEYFENKYGMGHLYAYDYPAINRIEQAAGRVIRTATDRGVVVLVDHRLSSPEIAGRFPDFWPQIACTSDEETLSRLLERFWSENHD